jgi:hypothetical protein
MTSEQRKRLAELRDFSLLLYGLERLFTWLQSCSLGYRLIGGRTSIIRPDLKDEERKRISKARGRKVEIYLGGWLLAEAAAVGLVANNIEPRWAFIWVALAAYRVFDILQATINITIFDPLRTLGKQTYFLALVRTLVMSFINFIELAICFGTIYAHRLIELDKAQNWRSAYYFSFITQLTIGYGDVSPRGFTRAIAVSQGMVGFFFGLVVLGRFISFLPRIGTLMHDDNSG